MIILRRPIITEKSMKLAEIGLYAFEVERGATKPQIGKVVADKFNVKVVDVKIVNIKGNLKQQRRVRKTYQTSGFKKALVHVSKGDKIALFETPKSEEGTVTTAESEPKLMREKKDLLGRTKVKVEKSAVGAAPTTQRKVITGK